VRNFNEADRKKKSERIHIKENYGNLSGKLIARLEGTIKSSLKEGYLSCPIAWKIAKDYNIPKIAVGEIADRLGIRITNCQLGCFKIEKTPYNESAYKNIDGEVITMLEELKAKGQITCSMIFDLARQSKVKLITITNTMSARGMKIRGCQLGCF
jgi:hypothetical protein